MDFQPDVVGISCNFTSAWLQTLELSRTLRKELEGVPFVIGGNHASGTAEYIMVNHRSVFDYVVIGPGEKAFATLCTALARKRALEDRIITAPRDELRLPAIELLDTTQYLCKRLTPAVLTSGSYVELLISRGCNGRCQFCTTPSFWGGISHYSKEQISEYLGALKKLGFEHVIIRDDQLLGLPWDILEHSLRLLKDLGFRYSIDNGVYLPWVDERFVRLLADTSCSMFFLPVRLPASDSLREKLSLLERHNVPFYIAFMAGFPGETTEDLEKYLEFGKHLRDSGYTMLRYVCCVFAHPYPGTEFYRCYPFVPAERRWEANPEFWDIGRLVFPISGILMEEAEDFVRNFHHEMNGASFRFSSVFSCNEADQGSSPAP